FDPVIRAAPEPDILGAITTAEFPPAVSSEPAPSDRVPLPRIEASVRLNADWTVSVPALRVSDPAVMLTVPMVNPPLTTGWFGMPWLKVAVPPAPGVTPVLQLVPVP